MGNHLLFGTLLLLAYCKVLAAQQQLIPKPEELAGSWETYDGQGGMVRMHISISSHFEGTPIALTSDKQYLDDLEVALDRRSNLDVRMPMENFFSTSSDGGVTWDGQQLRLIVPRTGGFPKAEVSLSWDETKRRWHGRYALRKFHRPVWKRLDSSNTRSFAGTWFDSKRSTDNCVHIGQQMDGTLTVWSDDISVPGRLRYANGIKPPLRSNEHYGESAKAQVSSNGLILVDLQAYTAMCCSHPFQAALSSDGSRLVGKWLSGPNQAPEAVEWKRLRENSCVAAVDESPLP